MQIIRLEASNKRQGHIKLNTNNSYSVFFKDFNEVDHSVENISYSSAKYLLKRFIEGCAYKLGLDNKIKILINKV